MHSLIETQEGLGAFETVKQTRDEVEGLHNCPEFSQTLESLYQAMQTQEKKFFIVFIKYFSKLIRQMIFSIHALDNHLSYQPIKTHI